MDWLGKKSKSLKKQIMRINCEINMVEEAILCGLCNAPLEISGESPIQRCSHCGTSNRVRGLGGLERIIEAEKSKSTIKEELDKIKPKVKGKRSDKNSEFGAYRVHLGDSIWAEIVSSDSLRALESKARYDSPLAGTEIIGNSGRKTITYLVGKRNNEYAVETAISFGQIEPDDLGEQKFPKGKLLVTVAKGVTPRRLRDDGFVGERYLRMPGPSLDNDIRLVPVYVNEHGTDKSLELDFSRIMKAIAKREAIIGGMF
jgi:hypothetical protein